MKIDKIKEKLSIYYDNVTVEYLSKCIYDFQCLYLEKYLTTEEVITLLITNIPKGLVIYDNIKGEFDAICSLSSGEFKIDKEVLKNKEYFEYVLFHEFIHAISFKKCDNVQYMGFYTKENGDDYEFKSKSFNEAFTEYITLKRNEMYDYKIDKCSLSGYDVGAHEFYIITKIIPEEIMIDLYFNHPNKLNYVFEEHNMNLDEIFYSFKVLEGKENEIYSLENGYGLDFPENIYKIIDGGRYLFFNIYDATGTVVNEETFNTKWEILLSEFNLKYNFYNIDGIFRIGQLCSDMEKINMKYSPLLEGKITMEELEKYKYLSSIFNLEDKHEILSKLFEIYEKDYQEYFELFKESSAFLAYLFLNQIKNNYQLYDLEIYPRVFKYLQKENTSIDNVDFTKIMCEEAKIKFYIFNINGKKYIEANYDDTIVEQISSSNYLVKYQNQVDKLNINTSKYIMNNNEFNCKKIY